MRDYGILVQQFAQGAIRLQQTRAAPVLQPRTALIDPAYEQRRQHYRQQRFDQSDQCRGHSANASSVNSVAKL